MLASRNTGNQQHAVTFRDRRRHPLQILDVLFPQKQVDKRAQLAFTVIQVGAQRGINYDQIGQGFPHSAPLNLDLIVTTRV